MAKEKLASTGPLIRRENSDVLRGLIRVGAYLLDGRVELPDDVRQIVLLHLWKHLYA